jgi:methionyl-tRNA formyltransferase
MQTAEHRISNIEPQKLRIVYMGTPEFAVPSLDILVENGYDIAAVITAPDKASGRGLQLLPSDVKVAAEKHGLKVLQPANLKAPEFIEELKSLNANLQIVVAFRMLPETVWSMPEIGTFNLHASLLPQYRGAAPINWVLINGERETGVTTFFLKHEIDTGSILFQEKETITPEDDAGTLYNRMMNKGAKLVLKTVQAIESGNYTATPQKHEGEIKHAPKVYRTEINWNEPSEKIINLVRGMSPFPGTWTKINDKTYKIFKVSKGEGPLKMKTADGYVSIEELQPEGKKRMKAADFLRGHKL